MKCTPPLRTVPILTVSLLLAPHVFADADTLDDRASLRLDESLFAIAAADKAQPTDADSSTSANSDTQFGDGHTWWWSVGLGLAGGDQTAHIDYNGFVSFQYFMVKNFEVGMEFGGWFFNQQGQDAGAGSFILNFRYHFYNKGRLSIFGEAGAGMILSTQPVPAAFGTTFNFTPRAGMGLTWRYGKTRSRILFGLRWQHDSNARLFGAGRNPGRDNAMVYGGLMFPF